MAAVSRLLAALKALWLVGTAICIVRFDDNERLCCAWGPGFGSRPLSQPAPLERKLLAALEQHPKLAARVARLRTIDGVGAVVALIWALEIGEPERFGSIRRAVSYCGLCAAQRESAGREQRGPLSKQRNKHLQTTLIEAAKLAPRYNEALRAVYERESQRGPRNRATVAVARKLVAYLLAVDRREEGFDATRQTA